MTNTNAIATKLNVLESAIVRVEEWASVLFVVVRGLGARFVSKKVVDVKMTATKLDKANHVANVFAAEGWKVNVWTGGDKVRVYFGKSGMYIDITNNGRQMVGKHNQSALAYNILRSIDLDAVVAGTQVIDNSIPEWQRLGYHAEWEYDMEHVNGRYYG